MRHQVLNPSGIAALPSRTYTHNVASSRFIRDQLVTIHSGIHHYRAVSHVPGHHLSHMSPYRTGHRCPEQHDDRGPSRLSIESVGFSDDSRTATLADCRFRRVRLTILS